MVEELARYDRVARQAQQFWEKSGLVFFHKYLCIKRVFHSGIRKRGNVLVIPLCDVDGKIWSCQLITETGDKKFLTGGKTKGNFYLIGKITGHVYIAEGFATGATIYAHFTTATAIAFNAGNLKPVAQAIRKKYPDIKITVAADNDIKECNDKNPGITFGREAAAAVGGYLIYPNFNDIDGEGSDFNDYVNLGGVL